MQWRKLFTFWFGLSLGILHAQQGGIAFHHLTTGDGLSDGKIRCIGQDTTGQMWFGTGYGLNRFNGYEIAKYMYMPDDTTTISGQQVYQQLATSSGSLYFSGLGVPNRFDLRNGTFQRFCFGDQIHMTAFCEGSEGVVWVSGESGLIRYREETQEITEIAELPGIANPLLARIPARDMVWDKRDKVYLGTEQGLVVYNTDTGQFFQYLHNANDVHSLPGNDVRNIVIDQSGIVWLSTDYYGSRLVKFDPQSQMFTTYDGLHVDRVDWVDNRIMDLLVDNQNTLWIASLRAGLAAFDNHSETFDVHLHDPMNPASIASNAVFSLFMDRDGMIWVGTEGYGVDYFDPARNYFTVIGQSSFQSPTLSDPWCRAIATDATGNMWIGTYKGVSCFVPEQNAYRNYLLARERNSEANNSVRSVLVDVDQSVWIGTGGGLNRYDPSTQRISAVGDSGKLNTSFISQLFLSHDTSILVSTPSGLYSLDRITGAAVSFFEQSDILREFAGSNVTGVFEDREQSLWIFLGTEGLLHYRPTPEGMHLYPMQSLSEYAGDFDYITSMDQDADGKYWIASSTGLIVLDLARDTMHLYSVSSGLPSGKTSAVRIDALNRVWVATNEGLCVFDQRVRQFTCYDIHDGLPTDYFYEGAAYTLSDGRFAYPTYAGVVLFDPLTIHDSLPLITPQITSVKAANTELLAPGDASSDLRLGCRENFFSIVLTGRHYANPERIIYRYKLDGFDKDWIQTHVRQVNYTNVPGGDYNFRYSAFLEGSNRRTEEQVLKIHVDTPLLQRIWFRTLLVLILLCFVSLIFWLKLRGEKHMHRLKSRAEQLEKEKTLVLYNGLRQQLNPHFLFNSLTSLKSMIRVDQQVAVKFLDMMSSVYRYILRSNENELVALGDELRFAQTFLDLQKTRFQEGLEIRICIDPHLDAKRIVPLTLQNLIENAVKHNQIDPEKPLTITIVAEGAYLVVSNTLQKKDVVETSNGQGLMHLISLYRFYDVPPIQVEESEGLFVVRVPLL